MGKNHGKTTIKKRIIAALKSVLFFCIAFILTFGSIYAAKADELGNNKTFIVDSLYDSSGREKIEATLKSIGLNSYVYVEDEYYNNLSSDLKREFDSYLNTLTKNFDDVIYPKTRESFGEEWGPGIDNDRRITIFLTATKSNVGGYFNPNDEYSKEDIVNGKSNEREMLYLNALYLGDERIKSFLAHEFQHMITWYHKTKLRELADDIWLNEGRSEYASTAIGYDNEYPTSNLRSRVKNFIANPGNSLVEWQNDIYDYSSVNLFSQYLADHFGKEIFKTMIGNEKTGIESVNNALSVLDYKTDFGNIFSDWTVANYLNDKTLSDNQKYGYINPNLSYQNLHINLKNGYTISTPSQILNLNISLKDWSGDYYEFKARESSYDEKNALEINFNGDNQGKFAVPYVVYYKNGIKEIKNLTLDSNQDARLRIGGFGKDISSVLIIPNSQKQISGFTDNINSYSATISAKMIQAAIYKNYPDGSLLKSIDEEKVYFIEKNRKRWITSVAAFTLNGYDWKNIVLVLTEELNDMENGENISASAVRPNGSLVKGSDPKTYLIENGKKRWITSAQIFASKGYKWEDVKQISDEELNLYPEGENISSPISRPNGSLIKGLNPKIYLIENGKKRWITSARTFVLKGYKWKSVEQISDTELNSYPDGENINR